MIEIDWKVTLSKVAPTCLSAEWRQAGATLKSSTEEKDEVLLQSALRPPESSTFNSATLKSSSQKGS